MRSIIENSFSVEFHMVINRVNAMYFPIKSFARIWVIRECSIRVGSNPFVAATTMTMNIWIRFSNLISFGIEMAELYQPGSKYNSKVAVCKCML